jgi:hypothetical protein
LPKRGSIHSETAAKEVQNENGEPNFAAHIMHESLLNDTLVERDSLSMDGDIPQCFSTICHTIMHSLSTISNRFPHFDGVNPPRGDYKNISTIIFLYIYSNTFML